MALSSKTLVALFLVLALVVIFEVAEAQYGRGYGGYGGRGYGGRGYGGRGYGGYGGYGGRGYGGYGRGGYGRGYGYGRSYRGCYDCLGDYGSYDGYGYGYGNGYGNGYGSNYGSSYGSGGYGGGGGGFGFGNNFGSSYGSGGYGGFAGSSSSGVYDELDGDYYGVGSSSSSSAAGDLGNQQAAAASSSAALAPAVGGQGRPGTESGWSTGPNRPTGAGEGTFEEGGRRGNESPAFDLVTGADSGGRRQDLERNVLAPLAKPVSARQAADAGPGLPSVPSSTTTPAPEYVMINPMTRAGSNGRRPFDEPALEPAEARRQQH